MSEPTQPVPQWWQQPQVPQKDEGRWGYGLTAQKMTRRRWLAFLFPTPLLMLVAFGDHLVPSELATAAFEHAHEPKRLIVLPGGHFDAYVAGFAAASGPARDWFVRHLAP